MYRPLIGFGWSRLSAQLSVFLFSAVFHEIAIAVRNVPSLLHHSDLLSPLRNCSAFLSPSSPDMRANIAQVPLGILRPWSFIAMLTQVPLAILTEVAI